MTWAIITCTPGKEVAAEAVLARLGHSETFFPSKWVDARPRGKQKRGLKQQERRIRRAWVTGYVFVYADQIEIHRINRSDHPGKLWLRVLTDGDKPARVTDEAMAAMKDIPSRVAAYVEQAVRKEREQWEARRPAIGARVRITDGLLTGWTGIVTNVTDGICTVDFGAASIKVPITAAQKCEGA